MLSRIHMTTLSIHMLYGIITVAAQQMSAAIFRTNATVEWPRETMLLNISSLWKTRLKPGGEDDSTFPKLCGCCRVVPRREVPGFSSRSAEALLWLMGCLCCRVQFPQRSEVWLPERLRSALAVASADWLSTQRLWRQR